MKGSEKLKCNLDFRTTKKQIDLMFNDLKANYKEDEFYSYNSSQINYSTDFVCDIFYYQEVIDYLNKIKKEFNDDKAIKITTRGYSFEKRGLTAYEIVVKTAKFRWIKTMISTVNERIIATILKRDFTFIKERFSDYDLVFKNSFYFDLKNTKIPYEFFHDFKCENDISIDDKKIIVKMLDIKNQNKIDIENKFIILNISKTKNNFNILKNQTDLKLIADKLRKIRTKNNLDDYMFEITKDNTKIKVIMIIFFVD